MRPIDDSSCSVCSRYCRSFSYSGMTTVDGVCVLPFEYMKPTALDARRLPRAHAEHFDGSMRPLG
jgi:hypothetical protein